MCWPHAFSVQIQPTGKPKRKRLQSCYYLHLDERQCRGRSCRNDAKPAELVQADDSKQPNPDRVISHMHSSSDWGGLFKPLRSPNHALLCSAVCLLLPLLTLCCFLVKFQRPPLPIFICSSVQYITLNPRDFKLPCCCLDVFCQHYFYVHSKQKRGRGSSLHVVLI